MDGERETHLGCGPENLFSSNWKYMFSQKYMNDMQLLCAVKDNQQLYISP